MSKDPAFLFYSQDFIMGTTLMTNEQVGIYIKLLCIQHQHGGLIDKTSFNSMVGNFELLRSKFIETEDGFFNKRLADEMVKRSIKSTNLSENAKKRWELHAKAMQLHSKSITIAYDRHMPIEDENEIENKKQKNQLNSFEDIWNRYPNKDGKKQAFRHFKTSVHTKEDWININKALDYYLASEKVQKGFIKNGSTWFNNWQDWIKIEEEKMELI